MKIISAKKLTSVLSQSGGHLSSGYHVNKNVVNLKLNNSNYMSGFKSPNLSGGAISSGTEPRTYRGTGGAISSGTEPRTYRGTGGYKTKSNKLNRHNNKSSKSKKSKKN